MKIWEKPCLNTPSGLTVSVCAVRHWLLLCQDIAARLHVRPLGQLRAPGPQARPACPGPSHLTHPQERPRHPLPRLLRPGHEARRLLRRQGRSALLLVLHEVRSLTPNDSRPQGPLQLGHLPPGPPGPRLGLPCPRPQLALGCYVYLVKFRPNIGMLPLCGILEDIANSCTKCNKVLLVFKLLPKQQFPSGLQAQFSPGKHALKIEVKLWLDTVLIERW